MLSLQQIESKIKNIEERNIRVEIDKAWETSWYRKIFLMVFTYLSIGIYMYAINVYKPWLNAIISTIGFFLSSMTLPIFKDFWKKHYYHK